MFLFVIYPFISFIIAFPSLPTYTGDVENTRKTPKHNKTPAPALSLPRTWRHSPWPPFRTLLGPFPRTSPWHFRALAAVGVRGARAPARGQNQPSDRRRLFMDRNQNKQNKKARANSGFLVDRGVFLVDAAELANTDTAAAALPLHVAHDPAARDPVLHSNRNRGFRVSWPSDHALRGLAGPSSCVLQERHHCEQSGPASSRAVWVPGSVSVPPVSLEATIVSRRRRQRRRHPAWTRRGHLLPLPSALAPCSSRRPHRRFLHALRSPRARTCTRHNRCPGRSFARRSKCLQPSRGRAVITADSPAAPPRTRTPALVPQ